MTGVSATIPKAQFLDNNGNPASGFKLYTYQAGTTTNASTYQDKALGSQNTNPIILDSRGECVLWLDPSITYKFVLKTDADALIWTVDNIASITAGGTWSVASGWTIQGVAEGPVAVVDNGSNSNYFEFKKTGYTERGSIGALGAFEMNMSYNMDYRTGVHRPYNPAQDAIWIAMNQNGMYLQYAPATSAAGDVWDAGGRLYNWYVLNNGNAYHRGNGSFGDTPVASARVYAKGLTNNSSAYGFYATNSDGTECFKQYNNGQLYNNGNTGIGAAPLASARLYVKGESSDASTYGHYVANSSGTEIFTLKSNGDLAAIGVYNATTASAANVFVDSAGKLQRSTSARKYKDDIRDLEPVDLSRLRPVRYKSKIAADGDKDFIGFIADEAHEKGLVELVSYGSDGEVEGFQYDRVTALLWKKCQELEARLAELEAR